MLGQSEEVALPEAALAALLEALEKKDPTTAGHARRVSRYALAIAEQLGVGAAEREELRSAALLHDIGKIGVDDSILRKPSSLDEREWNAMRCHPRLGKDIVGRLRDCGAVVRGLAHHHERWDGSGYPDGLAGERIPRIARIIAVADSFDAMVSRRPYHGGISRQAAADEISRKAGTQFDPEVVEAFQLVLGEGFLGGV